MSRIAATFNRLAGRHEKALIAYIMAGDPTLAQTEKILLEIEKAGADLIELGVPFTDPVADGPVIQRASERALQHGTNLHAILEMVARLRKKTDIPMVLMSYCNPIYAFGLPSFFKEAGGAGVDGLIVPDLPYEEAGDFTALCGRSQVDLIFLVAPTTPLGRVEKILKSASGFIYYVSLTGITGARLTERNLLYERVCKVKGMTDLPVAVGFGISSRKDASDIARFSDGVIVGSAIVKIIEDHHPHYIVPLRKFISSLKKGMTGI